jgi:hypothetical protein
MDPSHRLGTLDRFVKLYFAGKMKNWTSVTLLRVWFLVGTKWIPPYRSYGGCVGGYMRRRMSLCCLLSLKDGWIDFVYQKGTIFYAVDLSFEASTK